MWGEPTKNGKEIFGFASPFQTTIKSNLILTFLFALFSVLTARRGTSSPRLVVTLNSLPPTEFGGNSKNGLC